MDGPRKKKTFALIGRWLKLVSARLTKGGHQIEEGNRGCRRLLGNRGAMRLGRRNDPGRVSNHWHFTMKVVPIRLALEDLYGEEKMGGAVCWKRRNSGVFGKNAPAL